MKKPKSLFTSECVTWGHPDKVCDCISDAILDYALSKDPKSRVAVECMATTNFLIIAGEVTCNSQIPYADIAREVIREIGYTDKEVGFDYETVEILVKVHEQSPDIAMGVDSDGAGDQGLMFGGACRETSELMPLPISIARALTNKLTEYQQENPNYFPDGKSQVTVNYGNDLPEIDTVIISIMHKDGMHHSAIEEDIKENVISPVLRKYGFSINDVNKIYINPTGNFVVGGPDGDTGLTGRKIIVDTYGGYFSHGGGAFSGKDPTKVDRSGAYMARYIAKNIVAAGLADKVEVQIAYAIGVKKPVSVNLKCFGTSKFPTSLIAKAVFANVDMSPKGIIQRFELTDYEKVSYKQCAGKGHFGETEGVLRPWEVVDIADALLKYCEDNYVERFPKGFPPKEIDTPKPNKPYKKGKHCKKGRYFD